MAVLKAPGSNLEAILLPNGACFPGAQSHPRHTRTSAFLVPSYQDIVYVGPYFLPQSSSWVPVPPGSGLTIINT